MIEHLKKLEQLRQKIDAAGPMRKIALASEIGEASFQFADAVAQRIIKLEQEIAQCQKLKP